MRVLVVGTAAPAGGAAGRALSSLAAALQAEGHRVELCSPDPRSAAHRQAGLKGPLLGLVLLRLAPRFDAVVVRFESGLPLGPPEGRLGRAVALTATGLALRAYGAVTLRFDGGLSIPGGLGGRAAALLWKAADHVVVRSEEDRSALVAVGVAADVVDVVVAERAEAKVSEGWVDADDDDVRTGALELVRARAQAQRAAARAGGRLGEGGVPPSSPLDGPRPRQRSSARWRAGVYLTRRLARRALAGSR